MQKLGPEFAAAQLVEIFKFEAMRDGDVEGFARDYLVRELRFELLRGWNGGPHSESLAASAIAHLVTALPKEWKDRAWATWEALKRQDPPPGWAPRGAEDPLIEKAFREGWRKLATLQGPAAMRENVH